MTKEKDGGGSLCIFLDIFGNKGLSSLQTCSAFYYANCQDVKFSFLVRLFVRHGEHRFFPNAVSRHCLWCQIKSNNCDIQNCEDNSCYAPETAHFLNVTQSLCDFVITQAASECLVFVKMFSNTLTDSLFSVYYTLPQIFG